jgi:3-oxoadipate enol-lactonase
LAFIEANGVSFQYRLEGAGPVVVLLHEIGGSLESWDGIVPDLAKRFRVFRYDQRGFGLTEKVRAAYTLDTLTDDLEALLKALGLAAPYRIVSLAASSMQALQFWQRRPKDVASFVFCNPAPGVDPSRADALNAVAAKAEAEGIRGIIPAMLDKSYPPSLSDKETYDAYRGRYMANDPAGFAHAFRMMAKNNLLNVLSAVTCPSLVVAGRQDFIRAVSVTEGIAKQIPGARMETIDAGHFMPTTSPKALLALLNDFWT